MMKRSFVFLGLLALGQLLTAQNTSLQMPVEIKNAYTKGTRKYDGTVSPTYWQNHSDYTIKAKIDPKKRLLTGKADIVYHNASPDSLSYIYFHTYQDQYQKYGLLAEENGGKADPTLKNKGFKLDKFSINGTDINFKDNKDYSFENESCNNYTKLPSKLAPGGNLAIHIEWHYTIQLHEYDRSGAIDPTSMFIAYWYPEIAVRDDIDGWDRIPYDASFEYYHDNSNYNVELEVPNTYLVWASVAPSNSNEVYPDFITKNLETAKTATGTTPIITEADLKKGIKTKSNIWKFNAKNFPDFAFAISNDYVWDAGNYTDNNGSYFFNAVYNPKHTGYKAVVETQVAAVKLFHNEFPKREFPFHHFVIFDGTMGGGMEFPGMANDMPMSGGEWEEWTGEKKSDFDVNMGLSLHEMCHMFFPFYMGINEKKYAWMDEGWATFSEYILEGDKYNNYSMYNAGKQEISPMMTPTYTQTEVSSTNSYTMSSMSYYSLLHLLGQEKFDKCLKEYMNRWEQKHPTPYDFFYTFNNVADENLNWFWNNWYFDWGYVDLEITGYNDGAITIKNVGGKAVAFNVTVIYEDETETNETISPKVWQAGDTYTYVVNSPLKITGVKLKNIWGTDINAKGNTWPGK